MGSLSTPATIPCLLYFAALFLTVATLWILLYADPNEASAPQDFFVLILVIMPFVMLVYFGLAVIICDKIGVARGWPTTLPLKLPTAEGLAAAVTYIGLTAWLWLRWCKRDSVKEGYCDEARRGLRRISPNCRSHSASPEHLAGLSF